MKLATTIPLSSTITDKLTLQIANMFCNDLGIQQTQSNLDKFSFGFKLNGDNYPLWAILMKKAIGGRGKKSHLTVVYLWHQKRLNQHMKSGNR